MKNVIGELERKLQTELNTCSKEENTLKRLELSGRATRRAIVALENLLEASGPVEIETLILYNKVWAPPFYAKFILFAKCSYIESLKLTCTANEQSDLYAHELTGINHFFRTHTEFCRHYYSGKTDWDAIYFGQVNTDDTAIEDVSIGFSGKQNRGCLLVAHILAYEEYRRYLEPKEGDGQLRPTGKKISWKASAADLVELITPLTEFIELDGKPITKTELLRIAEATLGVSLKNSSVVDNRNRNRVKDPAAFLTRLKDIYLNRMDDLEEARRRR